MHSLPLPRPTGKDGTPKDNSGGAMNTPVVSGPVTGGDKGWPFGRPTLDFHTLGYREEEYFLEGTAVRYRPKAGTELGLDGRWEVEPAGSTPYRTRFVVYRPVEREAFNGTVLVSWNNVSAGFDGYTVDSPEILGSGFAYVAVSAQRAGVHGMGEQPMGLVQWDPERYGSLSISSDDYSFDIFTQAARTVAAKRSRLPIDPLHGLDVRHLVAIGGSQSASRLGAYINAVQPLEHLFDAFMPYLYFGGGSPLDVGEEVFNPASRRLEGSSLPMIPCLIRDDLDALVMIVNSEVEAIACYGVRQPDTDRFRYWEVAGRLTSPSSRCGPGPRRWARTSGWRRPVSKGSTRCPSTRWWRPPTAASRNGWKQTRRRRSSPASSSLTTRRKWCATNTASPGAGSGCRK